MRIPNVALADEASRRIQWVPKLLIQGEWYESEAAAAAIGCTSPREPTFQVTTEPGGKPIEIVGVDHGRGRDESVVCINGRICRTDAEMWAAIGSRYGASRRKPTERCAVMGDGIEVVRGVVVE